MWPGLAVEDDDAPPTASAAVLARAKTWTVESLGPQLVAIWWQSDGMTEPLK